MGRTMLEHVVLVRHGESEHLVREMTGGWSCDLLTTRGRDQARLTGAALAPRLQGKAVSFYSSDLPRAAQTAEIIADWIGIQASLRSELRELDNGVARGKTVEEAQALELPVTQPLLDWVPYPEAESWRMMAQRVVAFMEEAAQNVDRDTVLIVSHGQAMIPVVHWWLLLDEAHCSKISFDFDCCSVTELTINAWGERTISKLNDTAHLRELA